MQVLMEVDGRDTGSSEVFEGTSEKKKKKKNWKDRKLYKREGRLLARLVFVFLANFEGG